MQRRSPPPGTSSWRDAVHKQFGIQVLAEPPAPDSRVFWATRCAPIKKQTGGTPSELYRSPLIGPFFRFVSRHELRFGVLSDLYGVHLDHETLDPYDVHPTSLTTARKRELGEIIGSKVRAEGFDAIVFVNNSPVRSRPYFEMLAASGLRVSYATRVLGEAKA